MRAAILILLISLGAFISGCGGSEKEKSKKAESSESTAEVKPSDTDKKVSLINDMSGVWSDGGTLVSIVYQNGVVQFWIDNEQKNVRLGDADIANETLNLLLKSTHDGHEVIWTLKKRWNTDKTSYGLVLTTEDGDLENLSFVRKITTDDLNKFNRLTSQFSSGSNDAQTQTKSNEQQSGSNDAAPVSSESVAKLASQYFFVSSDASSVDGISGFYANQVNYYGKGIMSSSAVMADKSQYLRRWTIRKYEQIGKISVVDGNVPGQKVATYKYRFYLANSKQEIVGTAVQDLTMQMVDGKLLIVGENGKTLTSKKTNLDTPEPSQQPTPEASKAY